MCSSCTAPTYLDCWKPSIGGQNRGNHLMRNVSQFPSQGFVPRRGPALEIRHLRYFVAIYEAGSVTKASLRVMVAQSALSQQLAQLEDELGVLLFARSPQGVAPT